MNNNFEFKLIEDIILIHKGKTELRLIGNSNVPYYKLPCLLWLFEKQLTGNNSFEDYKTEHQPHIIKKYANCFDGILAKTVLPEIKKMPLKEHEFNNLLIKTGLVCLNTANISNIVLDENTAVIRGISGGTEFHENIKYQGFEIHRYTTEDICALNIAYRKNIELKQQTTIKEIYDELAHQINLNS